ncbi:MAG: hypothetical protein GY754_39250 [bacterium]|nr:hypothetical protein [bacterium]
MNTKTTYIFCIAILLSVLILFDKNASADTITLKDGTVLIGKTIKTTKDEVIFNNFFGVFKVKKSLIKKTYITKDYKEDIKINKELGRTVDEKVIKKHVLAGQEAKKKEEEKKVKKEEPEKNEPEKEAPPWTGGRISLMGGYLMVTGSYRDTFPSGGFSTLISYEQGLDGLFGLKRHFYMPGFHLEGGYLYISNDPAKLSGFTCSAGPIWLIPFIKYGWGNITVSLLPGASFLAVKNTDTSGTGTTTVRNNSFTLYSALGYEYSFGDISAFIQGRYLYIYDTTEAFHGFGAFGGISYSLW